VAAYNNGRNIYIVLALFMLMGFVQKSSLSLYFSQNKLVATPNFGSVMSLDLK
jgi:hypothetical protein